MHSVVGQPMSLSVVVNEPHINSCHGIDQHCEISCAHSPKPTARNTFIIRRPPIRKHHHRRCNSSTDATTSIESDSQYLKYGQDFMLECYDSKQKPLMLYSSPQSPFGGATTKATSSSSAQCDYVFKVHGEMKQSVGLALLKGRNFNDPDDHTSIPSNFFHWRMFHINPEIRYETIGANIPVSFWKRIDRHSIFDNEKFEIFERLRFPFENEEISRIYLMMKMWNFLFWCFVHSVHCLLLVRIEKGNIHSSKNKNSWPNDRNFPFSSHSYSMLGARPSHAAQLTSNDWSLNIMNFISFLLPVIWRRELWVGIIVRIIWVCRCILLHFSSILLVIFLSTPNTQID